jgi:hypothetical protein
MNGPLISAFRLHILWMHSPHKCMMHVFLLCEYRLRLALTHLCFFCAYSLFELCGLLVNVLPLGILITPRSVHSHPYWPLCLCIFRPFVNSIAPLPSLVAPWMMMTHVWSCTG